MNPKNILPDDGATVLVCTVTIPDNKQNSLFNIDIQNLIANVNATTIAGWRTKEKKAYMQDMLTLPSEDPTITSCQNGTAMPVSCTSTSKTRSGYAPSSNTIQKITTIINR